MGKEKRELLFSEYKAIKDEISTATEEKFLIMLTKQFKELRAEIINEMDKKFNVIYWLFGVLISIMIALKFIK
jgi:hypothetical protein